jgi:uncharacterized protein YbcV (DUF1398 family)
MARSIRTKYFLKEHGMDNSNNYEKQIYIKNKNWHPPPAHIQIENAITNFEKMLKSKQQIAISQAKKQTMTNLNPLQKTVLKQLRENKNIIIKPTDKNLGPAVMDKNTYIKQVLQEHLLTENYQQLSLTETKNMLDNTKNSLRQLIKDNLNALSTPEATFFKRSLNCHYRTPIFYGLPKVHKTPVALRPVVSSVNSFLSVFSTWLDYRMKELLPLIRSHVKNSIEVITDIKALTIPENALLFSADAQSMYTNIDTNTGLQAFTDFFEDNKEKISSEFPVNLFLKILDIVMKNNIFTFANTTWLQLSGTAMGTPAACAYATISYGQYENSRILPKYSKNLLYYRRYIDDVFGIWLPPDSHQEATWEHFKKDLNGWGHLKWNVETPAKTSIFLDLTIELNETTIKTKTYQKDLNLHLYIPPNSAHPPSCLKGLISGEMRRYWLQNDPQDFENIMVKFIERLVARGHSINNLTPIIMGAAASLDHPNRQKRQNENQDTDTIYIHWEYHPYGVQRKDIRDIYRKTLEPFLDYDKMTVAISRPKNLRDILTKAALTDALSEDIDYFLTNGRQQPP